VDLHVDTHQPSSIHEYFSRQNDSGTTKWNLREGEEERRPVMSETPQDKPRYGRYNANALRHGMSGNKLPAGASYVEKRVNGLRRHLEAMVLELKGTISIVDAAAIQGALRWERHGALAAHWLRKMIDKLSPSDRLRFSEAMAVAGDKRDRCIKELGLDRNTEDDLLGDLYSRKARLLPPPKEEAG
jgi:hypothetical protein